MELSASDSSQNFRSIRRGFGFRLKICLSLVFVIAAAMLSATNAALARNNPRDHDGLTGVSCPSTTSCMAVGFSHDGRRGLVELWNGTTWSVARPIGGIASVSCPNSTNTCVGVGRSVSLWNGITWTTVPKTRVSPFASFTGVSCTAGGQCLAAGDTIVNHVGGRPTPLVAAGQLNNTVWPISYSSNITFERGNIVSCTDPSFCMTVGDGLVGTPPSIQETAMAAEWNGSALVTVPGPVVNGMLWGVSCTSPSECVAVGQELLSGSSFPAPLVESWDGTTWSIVTTPSVYGSLSSVSCPTTSFCLAIGATSTDNFITSSALAEEWNGTTWTVVPTPSFAAARETTLSTLSCASASACMAVGDVFTPPRLVTLIEQWNGVSWSQVASPNP